MQARFFFVVALMSVSGVVAQTRVRLVSDDQTITHGRLELSFGGQWFAVCDQSGSASLGNWACGQLGYGTYVSSSSFGNAPAPEVAIVTISCAAGSTIDQCVKSGASSTCTQFGLVCSAHQCLVTDWSIWSPCSATCGGGTQSRSRTISQLPTNGLLCPTLVMSQACNTQPCFGCTALPACTAYDANCNCSVCATGYALTNGMCTACGVNQCNAYSSGCACSSCTPGFTGSSCSACIVVGCSAFSSGCTCSACSCGYTLTAGTCVAM